MDLTDFEKQRLINLCNIRDAQPNIELECLFNYKDKTHFTEFKKLFTYIKSKASLNQGAKYQKDTWSLIESKDMLDITVHKNNNIHKRSDLPIRLSIDSKQDISKFCQTNSLEGLNTSFAYKNTNNVYMGIHASQQREMVSTSPLIGDKVVVSTEDGMVRGIVDAIYTYPRTLMMDYTIKTHKGKTYTIKYTDKDTITLIDYGMYLKDYDMKINVKSEVNLANLEYKEDKDYYENEAIKYKQQYDSFLASSGGIEEVYKTFRLKNRYSYHYNNLRLDITVVRSSKSELNNKGFMVQVPHKTLIDSNLINEDKHYEIELEIDYDYLKRGRGYADNIYNTGNIGIKLCNTLYDLLVQINNYPSIISHQDSNIVLQTYKSLIRSNHKDILDKKMSIIEYMLQQKALESMSEDERKSYVDDHPLHNIDDISPTYVEQYTQLITSNKSNIKKLQSKYTKLLQNIDEVKYSYSANHTYFIGPKLVSMNIKDVQKNSTDNIMQENYTITDKADGLGMLLYVYGYEHLTDHEIKTLLPNDDIRDSTDILDNQFKGHMFLIDQNLKVYRTNLSFIDSLKDEYTNTLVNGEYLFNDRAGHTINMFKIYDGYIYHNRDIKGLPLKNQIPHQESRLSYVAALLSSEENIDKGKILYNNRPILNYTNDILQISTKKFSYCYTHSAKSSKKSKSSKVSKASNKQRMITELFTESEKIWSAFTSGLSIYKYDGLIYTPLDTPVAYTTNSCDYDLYTHTMWNKNIKWKPPYENTIDFLVKEVKEETEYNGNIIYSPLIKTKRNNRDGNVVYKKYKTFHLYVGKNITNDNNACRTTMRPKNRYLPVQFVPSILYDDMAYVANIEVNTSDNEIHTRHWDHVNNRWEEVASEIIKDDTVVEFAYANFDVEDGHYKTDKTFRWIPIRNRHDKTFSYKKGSIEKHKLYNILKYLLHLRRDSYNQSSSREFKSGIKQYIRLTKSIILDIPKMRIEYRTSNYNQILNEIIHNKDRILTYYASAEYISKGISINYGNNYNTANSVWFSIHNPITPEMICTGVGIPQMDVYELKYYNQDISVKRSKSISLFMQRFHNNIKLNLIKQLCDRIRNGDSAKPLHLLDLATGKGGDIYKWMNNRVDNVVGIDKVYDNIYNSFDGACVRHKNYREKNINKMPMIDFVVADVSKPLDDDTHFMDMFSKDIWFSKYQDTQFDIITMMFALHYMFNDEDKVSILINNIDKQIKKGGYFIGCCFDGKAVFDLLQDMNVNDVKTGRKNEQIIWKITKKYDLNSWSHEDPSIFYNLPIDVYIRSINMNITEYLVNFEIFVQKLQEVNIKLIQTNMFKDIYDVQKTVQLSEDEKTLSFLNRQFIFKKVSDTEIVVEKMVQLTLRILSNDVKVDGRVTKKFKAEFKRSLKKNDITSASWSFVKGQVQTYIQDQGLNDDMPILDEDFDGIMDSTFAILRSKKNYSKIV